MLNKYPLWKNILIVIALGIAVIYAFPNLYPDQHALQITGTKTSVVVGEAVLKKTD